MVSVILVWIYMVITCYVTGYTCLTLACAKAGYSIKKDSSYLFAGIAFLTVYAQFFSIFYRVGLAANLILLLVCGVCLLFYGKQMSVHLKARWEEQWKGTKEGNCSGRRLIKPLLLLLLVFVFAYGTSTGIIHYDTSLYHAQSIRWIEEYGVVPGLGNLHTRLAYNSAAFCLSALYSFAFLGGQSYHCVGGFLALLLAVVCFTGLIRKEFKKPLLSDFVRIMGIYYLLIIFDEMISPASDYFMVLVVFYILITWLELLERKEAFYMPYGLLCVLCVSVVTMKLSGALILLLTVKPAVMLIREKRGKEIAGFLGVGILTVLPFLIRNVILSGWLVYPFTFLDLFDFDFKIPRGVAEYDSREIQVWGRGYSDVTRYDEPISQWLPGWIASLDSINKLFLLLAIAALLVFMGIALYAFVKKRKEMFDFLLVAGCMAASFLFWLTSAPLIRYGCIYLWVFPMLVWGYVYLQISPKMDKYKLYLVFLLAIGCYKTGAFAAEAAENATADYLIVQKDYDNYETISYELHGYTFYYPAHGDQTGYEDFPSSPIRAEDIFRGESIKDGFVDVVH